jgi:alkylation response protein AidB-like acyl-CoA dehydrogenase
MTDSPTGHDGAMSGEPLDEFRRRARAWLADRLKPLERDDEIVWGEGSDDVSIFHKLAPDEERELLDRGLEWQRAKFEAGFGAISIDERFGGAGLPAEYALAFRQEERRFRLPANHEALRITVNLIAPTISAVGTDAQRERLLPQLLGGTALACQLFSEPGAGSDLAAVSTRAVRDGDDWVINGSKVWASGARFAQWGQLVVRTDPDASKHGGLTNFLVPMDAPGIEVRPIVQMSGGASFNEVFLHDVRVSDDLRLGEPGTGWKVALMTLGFERGQSGAKSVGGSWDRLRALATENGATVDPVVRQRLAAVYTHERLRTLTRLRAEAGHQGPGGPGPEGSLGKLLWVQGMLAIGDAAATILGPRLVADTGEWGTYAWADHVLGAPGFRIAGGSDEIQRNILGERVLGLPAEPRPDRDTPWRALVSSPTRQVSER